MMNALNVRRRLACAAVSALYLAHSVNALSQMRSQGEFSPQHLESVEQWDESLESLRKLLWTAQGSVNMKDTRGRAPADDFSEFLLSASTMKRLDELRDQARARQADPEALKGILAQAEPVLTTELYKATVIGMYWSAHEAIAYHQKILAPWLAVAEEADRKAVTSHLSATDEELRRLLTDSLGRTSASERIAAIRKLIDVPKRATSFYNRERVSIVQASSGNAGAPALQTRKREDACTTPVSSTSGKSQPAIASANQAPETFYPSVAKRASVEGSVIMRLNISVDGCMESGEIAQSSGDESLDAAALDWAEHAQFLPAAKDGKPVPAAFSMRLKFELRE